MNYYNNYHAYSMYAIHLRAELLGKLMSSHCIVEHNYNKEYTASHRGFLRGEVEIGLDLGGEGI